MLLLSAPGADVVRPAATASKLGAGDSLTAFFFCNMTKAVDSIEGRKLYVPGFESAVLNKEVGTEY
jgi:hypothetical protein